MARLQQAQPRFAFVLGFLLLVFPTDILSSITAGPHVAQNDDGWWQCLAFATLPAKAPRRASRPSLVAGPRLVARARHLGVGRRLALRLLADARSGAGRDGLAALGRKLGVVRGAAEPLLQSFEDPCDAASIRRDRPSTTLAVALSRPRRSSSTSAVDDATRAHGLMRRLSALEPPANPLRLTSTSGGGGI
jgi:hypothetical protein